MSYLMRNNEHYNLRSGSVIILLFNPLSNSHLGVTAILVTRSSRDDGWGHLQQDFLPISPKIFKNHKKGCIWGSAIFSRSIRAVSLGPWIWSLNVFLCHHAKSLVSYKDRHYKSHCIQQTTYRNCIKWPDNVYTYRKW